jgi:hypothetical protein
VLKYVYDALSDNIGNFIALVNSFVLVLCEHTSTFATSVKNVVFSFEGPDLTNLVLVIYEYLINAIRYGSEFLGLYEWWGLEHSVFVVWFVLFMYFFYQRSAGNYQEIALQFTSGLSTLMMLGCYVRLIHGVQENYLIFDGNLKSPIMGILAVGLLVLGAIMNGIKKEIYGYGVNDLPADERSALVLDSTKTFINKSYLIILTWATFVVQPLDLKTQEYTPLLSIFPIYQILKAMNAYFAPEIDEELPDTSIWNRGISVVTHVGSVATLTCCLWQLTKDRHALELILIQHIFPYIILKARKKQLLTDNNVHLLSEAASLMASVLYYQLFRLNIVANRLVPPGNIPHTQSPKTTMHYEDVRVRTGAALTVTNFVALIGSTLYCIRNNMS